MSKVDDVRTTAVKVMKAEDKAKRDLLSVPLPVPKNMEISERGLLTEEEKNTVAKKEIKQAQGTYEMAPTDRKGIRSGAAARMAVCKESAPVDTSVEQIREVIAFVLSELGIGNPMAKDKGTTIKVLMPRVRGKADGRVVSEILASIFR